MSDQMTCGVCKGKGTVSVKVATPGETKQEDRPCPQCNGTGKGKMNKSK